MNPESRADVLVALTRVVAELSALADKEAGGTTTMRSQVSIPWAAADRAVWKVLREVVSFLDPEQEQQLRTERRMSHQR